MSDILWNVNWSGYALDYEIMVKEKLASKVNYIFFSRTLVKQKYKKKKMVKVT